MHETLCFSIQSPSPNLDDLPLRCDGCETVSCVVGCFLHTPNLTLHTSHFTLLTSHFSLLTASSFTLQTSHFSLRTSHSTLHSMVGSVSDHGRIILGSVPHCKWGFKCFSCMRGRQNSIVICNCRIVPAM